MPTLWLGPLPITSLCLTPGPESSFNLYRFPEINAQEWGLFVGGAPGKPLRSSFPTLQPGAPPGLWASGPELTPESKHAGHWGWQPLGLFVPLLVLPVQGHFQGPSHTHSRQ